MIVRKHLTRKGFRYRLHYSELPGRPDIVFVGKKLAVQIHGCFWHQHGCKNSTIPKTNRNFWAKKLADTVERDRRSARRIGELEWTLVEIWECEIEKNVKHATKELVELLGS